MIIVESNHMRVLRRPGIACEKLIVKLQASGEDVCTNIITVHEAVNGCLSEINKAKTVHEKVPPYQHLHQLFEFFADWIVLPFNDKAAAEFIRLRQFKELRTCGTMDLQIASIAIVHNAKLLSADKVFQDIARHSILMVEDWLLEEPSREPQDYTTPET